MKILILEDSPVYVSLLEHHLSKLSLPITITGIASSTMEALELIMRDKPDVLILDVELKGETSFNLFRDVSWRDFQIIFTTAFQDFAISAFEVQAIGYIVKPVATEQLLKYLQIARENIAMRGISTYYREDEDKLQISDSIVKNSISIPSDDGFDVIQVNSIIRCEAINTTTHILLTTGRKLISSYNIGKFYKSLQARGFFAPHRSHIINLSYVKQYLRVGLIIMDDGKEVPLVKDKRSVFVSLFSLNAKS